MCKKRFICHSRGRKFDLRDYPNHSFTTAILSQTIQAMIYPDKVIENLIRIAKSNNFIPEFWLLEN